MKTITIKRIKNQVRDQIWQQVHWVFQNHCGDQFNYIPFNFQIGLPVHEQVSNQVLEQVLDQVLDQVCDQINEEIQ